MEIHNLKDFEGRACVVLESGRGWAVKLISIIEQENMIKAQLEFISTNGFTQNRLFRIREEPFIESWWAINSLDKSYEIVTQLDEL